MRNAIVCALTLAVAATVAPAVVRNVPSALYPTIQSAENAALPGDTINIAAGVYIENVDIDVNSLIVQGNCYNRDMVIVDGIDDVVFDVSASNVTIKCLTIRNGDYGVNGSPGTGIQLQNLRILSTSSDGIYISDGDGFRIQAVEIRGAEGGGIYIGEGNNGTINSTTVRNVEDACIYLNDSSHTVVTGNTLLQCGSLYGLYIDGEYNSVTLNTITDTYYPGIYSNGNWATIWKNTLKGAGWNDDSVQVDGDDCTIDDNKITYSDYPALDVDGKRAKVRRNALQSFGSYCSAVNSDDLVFSDNTCTDSREGFRFFTADRARIERNTAERVGVVSYEIYGDDIKLLNNRSIDAGGYDVYYLRCDDCDATEIRGNQAVRQGVYSNGYAVFALDFFGGAAVVHGNSAVDGAGWGFHVYNDGSASCTVTNNVAIGNGTRGEAGFLIEGDDNTLSFNQSQENQGPGFEINGHANTLTQNSAIRNLQEGFYVRPSRFDNVLSQNLATGNAAEGFDNGGGATYFLFNTANFNRRDCTNDSFIGSQVGNNCFDGSNFNETSQVDN